MLRGLGKERTPQKGGGPEKEEEEAKRFGEREGELGKREGVGSHEGEEA